MKASFTKGNLPKITVTWVCLLALTACTKAVAPGEPAKVGDQAVARINGSQIWASDIRREAFAQGLIGRADTLDTGSPKFHQILDQVIDQKLLAGEAVRLGLDKSDESARRLAGARTKVLGDLVLENATAEASSERAVNALYQEMVKTHSPAEEVELSQVVTATQVEADQVKHQFLSGVSLADLAAQRSIDEKTRFKAGVLPPTTLDMLPTAYAVALKGATPGQLVGPFHSEAGWVVARLEAKRDAPPITLAVARPQIVRFLTFDRVKDLILNLHKGAKVETLIPALSPGPGPESVPGLAPAPAGLGRP